MTTMTSAPGGPHVLTRLRIAAGLVGVATTAACLRGMLGLGVVVGIMAAPTVLVTALLAGAKRRMDRAAGEAAPGVDDAMATRTVLPMVAGLTLVPALVSVLPGGWPQAAAAVVAGGLTAWLVDRGCRRALVSPTPLF